MTLAGRSIPIASAAALLWACSSHDPIAPEEPHALVVPRPAPGALGMPTTASEPLLVPPAFACGVRDDESVAHNQFPVPKPPFSAGVFPCRRCHDKPDDHNPNMRTLTANHRDIQLVHGSREQWCYDCHNPSNRDMLRLAGGRLVSFDHSYELCGQCHGEKLRDWRYGIHGRRTGCWNGKRMYLLCVNCHNPHSPRFKQLAPLPPPKPPGDIRLEARSDP